MLTLFSTAKPFTGHSEIIQRNALQSWKRLHPSVEVILFGDEEGAAAVCAEMGLRHEPHVERHESGMKYVDYLFSRAQQIARHDYLCYSNCDMVLLDDFLKAFEKARAWRKNSSWWAGAGTQKLPAQLILAVPHGQMTYGIWPLRVASCNTPVLSTSLCSPRDSMIACLRSLSAAAIGITGLFGRHYRMEPLSWTVRGLSSQCIRTTTTAITRTGKEERIGTASLFGTSC